MMMGSKFFVLTLSILPGVVWTTSVEAMQESMQESMHSLPHASSPQLESSMTRSSHTKMAQEEHKHVHFGHTMVRPGTAEMARQTKTSAEVSSTAPHITQHSDNVMAPHTKASAEVNALGEVSQASMARISA